MQEPDKEYLEAVGHGPQEAERFDAMEKPKVSLDVAWLSENGLLEEAAKVLGYSIVPGSANQNGCMAIGAGGVAFELCWNTDSFQFTLSQLKQLGFAE